LRQIDCDIVIVGAGIVGITTAYYLKLYSPSSSVVLLDAGQAMALTSAQSGENYRNWWPHPVMTAFTDHSIHLMEEVCRVTHDRINMSRLGYALATRLESIDSLMSELDQGYAQLDDNAIRTHSDVATSTYQKAADPDWVKASSGVDVLCGAELIGQHFPTFDNEIKTVIHVRRAGTISAQQMGQFMLEQIKAEGGRLINATVKQIEVNAGFRICTDHADVTVCAETLVNAAGPFINDVAQMLGTTLPVVNTLQQKIAFEDKSKAIPRQMPFAIDLDPQHINWTDEEFQLLSQSPEHAWLTEEMPGAIHCRPDGGVQSSWIKLGWAFNDTAARPTRTPELLDAFPEIVLRGASRLHPQLTVYYDQLPRSLHHYGGFYTLTEENWPLIGAMNIPDAYVVGAMSGFGSMAACAAGELCAQHVLGSVLPSYAEALSLERYQNEDLMSELHGLSNRGIL